MLLVRVTLSRLLITGRLRTDMPPARLRPRWRGRRLSSLRLFPLSSLLIIGLRYREPCCADQ